MTAKKDNVPRVQALVCREGINTCWDVTPQGQERAGIRNW